jgi:mRNA interferase MazF
MKRGEVWWARLNPPAGRRPVVLVSREDAYQQRQLVLVAPVTTRIRHIPSEVPLGREDGLPRRCVAIMETLLTVDKNSLEQMIAELSTEKVEAVDQALRYALGLR